MSKQLVAVILLTLGWPYAIAAQSAARAAYELQGTVTDWKDAPVANAILTLKGSERTYQVKSDRDGRYRFPSVVAAKYRASVVAEGFPSLITDFTLDEAPDGPINVKLQVALSERINVSADSVQTAGNFSTLTLSSEDLEGVPAGLLMQRLRELAGATGRPETIPIYVDGFRAGLRLPPKEAIEMVRISSNSFAPEFPEVGYGRIEITTKPGVDTYHGQFQFDMNDDGLNARDAFAATRGGSQSRNYSAYLGGPIVPLRWDFLAYSGRWEQDVSQVINALTVDPASSAVVPFNTNFLTPTRSANVFLQSGLLLSPGQSLTGSYSRTVERARNQGLESGRDLPEYGFNRTSSDHTVRAALISMLGSRTLNEMRIEWSGRRRDTQAATNGPAVIVFDAFNGGGNQSAFSSRDSRGFLQISNHVTRAYQKHTVKGGVEIKRDALDNLDRSGWGGSFVFGTDVERDASGSLVLDGGGQPTAIAPIENYRRTILGRAGYGPSQFSVVRGDPSVALSQWEASLFAQDDWRPSTRLTLSYGVRGERQTNLRGWFNVAPRAALAWTTDEKGRGTIRWGGGLFHSRVDPQLSFEALKLDGRHQQEIIVPRPQFFPAVPENLGVAASSSTIRSKDDALARPYTVVSSVVYERQLPKNLFGSIEYRAQKGGRLLRSVRIAPDSGALAPVLQFESTGRSSRHEIVAGMRADFSGLPMFLNYTLSFSRNDTDGASSFPADSSAIANELGWASDDQRHRLVISGSIALPMGISLSPFVTFGSGRPFNVTTGRDNNGDTIFMDRPAFASATDAEAVLTAFGWLTASPAAGARIVPRNFGRGSSEINSSLYIFKPFRLNGQAPSLLNQPSPGAPAPREYGVVLGASIENIINRTNLTGYNSVLTSPVFGSANRGAGPRRIQVSLSVSF